MPLESIMPLGILLFAIIVVLGLRGSYGRSRSDRHP
jgi:hypothetical protein